MNKEHDGMGGQATSVARFFLGAAAAAGFHLGAAGDAAAQLFASTDRAVAAFEAYGYVDVRIESLGLSRVTAEACRGDRRYRLEMDRTRRVRETADLGFCSAGGGYGQGGGQGYGAERAVTLDELESALASAGYDDVEIRGTFAARACSRSDLYDVTLYAYGAPVVDYGRRVGACSVVAQPRPRADRRFAGAEGVGAAGFEPAIDRIYRTFEAAGFFNPAIAAPFEITLCDRGRRRVAQVDISRYGRAEIRPESDIAPCARTIVAPGDQPAPPVYEPPAADAPISPRAAQALLEEQGYRRVFIDGRDGAGYRASACFSARRFEMTLSAAGEVVARRASGFCNVTDDGFEIAPERPLSEAVLNSNIPLDPATCQSVLNWFQANAPIVFRSGSADLDDRGEEIIKRMAQGVDRCGDVSILVEGHTDDRGDPYRNQILSEERALKVANLLVRYGVPYQRVRAAGYGQDHPVVPNDSRVDRALNRRIELNLEWGRFD